jgi:hypothetical protein
MFKILTESLDTRNDGLFHRGLMVDDADVLKDLMGLAMDDIDLSVEGVLNMTHDYPTKKIRIILKFDVFFRYFVHKLKRKRESAEKSMSHNYKE